jgi:hypothetical protein
MRQSREDLIAAVRRVIIFSRAQRDSFSILLTGRLYASRGQTLSSLSRAAPPAHPPRVLTFKASLIPPELSAAEWLLKAIFRSTVIFRFRYQADLLDSVIGTGWCYCLFA